MARRKKTRVSHSKFLRGDGKVIASHVRIKHEGGNSVTACVRIGKPNPQGQAGRNVACATGTTPKKAITKALRKLATRFTSRSSALAGLK